MSFTTIFQAEAMELPCFSTVQADRDSNPDLDGFGPVHDAAPSSPSADTCLRKELGYLFGPQAEQIAPLPDSDKAQGLLGLLAFGSYSEHRFIQQWEPEYLTRLGELSAKRLEVVSEPGLMAESRLEYWQARFILHLRHERRLSDHTVNGYQRAIWRAPLNGATNRKSPLAGS